MDSKRRHLIAEKLRLMASAIESCTTPAAFTVILDNFSILKQLLNLTAFSYQKKLIEAVKFEIDSTELNDVYFKKGKL